MESSKRIKLSLSKKLKEYANKMGRDHLGGDDIPGNKKKGGLRDNDGYDNVQYNRDMPMDEDSPESAHPQGSKKLTNRTTVMDMLDVISHKEFGPDYHKLSTKQKKEVHKLAIKGKLIKQSPFKESVNEADITIGGKEYNLKKSGSKITLINKKLSADKFIFKNVKDFKAWADDQVEPIGGTQSSHFGINEGRLSSKDAKKLSIGSKIKTKKHTYTIKGFGNKANAFRQFEVENEKGDSFNIQVSLYGTNDIEVAKGRSLVFRDTEMLESINESTSKEAMGIAGFTGTRGNAVQKFIDDYNLDARKLFNFVKKGKLKDRMEFVSAIAGKPGNKFQGKMVGMFGESVNENITLFNDFLLEGGLPQNWMAGRTSDYHTKLRGKKRNYDDTNFAKMNTGQPDIEDEELDPDNEVVNEKFNKVEHLSLLNKALKAMPGSQNQKEIIRQLNVVRKAGGMRPLKEQSIVEYASRLTNAYILDDESVLDGTPEEKDAINRESAKKKTEKNYKDWKSTNESLNSDISNAKKRLKDPHTIEDIEYSKTRRGDKFIKIIYKKKYVPGKMMDTGPHFVSIFYNDEKELQNIGKALKLKLKEGIEEETKRDYKDEYKKFQSSTKSKKYRAELNKYNRDKGTYGNGDNKDASHKGGKIVGFEAQSKNRGRAEKSRLKINKNK